MNEDSILIGSLEYSLEDPRDMLRAAFSGEQFAAMSPAVGLLCCGPPLRVAQRL